MHDDIEGDITSDKIVILARNRYIFQPLEDRLCENMIKFSYKMNPGAIQFESDLMKIFDLALRVRLNPQDVLHRQRLTTRLNTNYVDSLGLDDIVFQISDGLNKNILKTVMMLNDDGSNIRTVLEKFRNNLLEVDENDRFMIYNDIGELLSHWRNYAKKTDTKSLHQFKNAMALGQTHSLTQQDGITLSTVHTMKGQEYDIVFLVGMDDETFPDYRAVRSGGVEMAQEKNNLYVAFTRAKRFLYVTWPQNRMMPWGDFKSRKISRFLKDF
jgi:DNA helicase-2/ATP-dependent DNA helicase PcrA